MSRHVIQQLILADERVACNAVQMDFQRMWLFKLSGASLNAPLYIYLQHA